ncbi:lantibiotic dehydratase C-terminal domain-containing protein, partial [Pyxidicoccus sp. 3LG]
RCRAGLGAEHHVNARFEEQLSQRFRRERRELDGLLDLAPSGAGPWRAGLEALRLRGLRLRPIAERLQAEGREGRLTAPVETLADSFLHLHVNRMLAGDHRAQELILHDFLARLYRSRLARQSPGGP